MGWTPGWTGGATQTRWGTYLDLPSGDDTFPAPAGEMGSFACITAARDPGVLAVYVQTIPIIAQTTPIQAFCCPWCLLPATLMPGSGGQAVPSLQEIDDSGRNDLWRLRYGVIQLLKFLAPLPTMPTPLHPDSHCLPLWGYYMP